MIKKTLAFITLLTMFLVMSSVLVYAQPPTGGGNPPTGGGNPETGGGTGQTQDIEINIPNPLKPEFGNTIHGLFRAIVDNIILPIGGVLAVLAFIYSGFLYVTAQGNETKIATAHRALLYTAVGTAILLGAWVISAVIENTITQLRS